MAAFKTYILREREKTQQALQRLLEGQLGDFTELAIGFDQLLAFLTPYAVTGGKMGRALLIRLGYQLAGGKDEELVMPVSAAFELFHRFILSHDDIIDKDLERHGMQTIEAKFQAFAKKQYSSNDARWFGTSTAIVGGDLLHSLAIELIAASQFPASEKRLISRAFHECLMQTAAGWYLELRLKYTQIEEVELDEIYQAMKLVSGYYTILWPLRIGQLCAGVPLRKWMKPLETYGLEIGYAFQIQDDILGVFGERDVTGKPVGNDLREQKKSILLHRALELANTSQKEFLTSNLGKPLRPFELKRYQEIIVETGALAWTRKRAEEHAKAGLEALEELEKSKARSRLRELALFMIERNH